MIPSSRRAPRLIAVAVAASLAVAACGSDDSADTAADTTDPVTSEAPSATDAPDASGDAESITLYSGRGEDLVQPIIDEFVADSGIDVEVRYGDSAEMLLLIQEEGANSPADVYYSQGAGFLGVLSADDGLAELPADVLDRVVDPDLRSPSGDWVGLTGRARVVAYDTRELTESDLPDSLLDFTAPEWQGRIGWAPTNASFQDHVTAMRVILGEDGAREWLEGIIANDPVVYENNGAIHEALAAGEVDVGFTNHYYLFRYLAEDPDFPVATKFYTDGDPGALVNIAGAGVLATSDQPDAATELVRYLLSPEAQEMFSTANFELPVVADVEAAADVPSLDSLVLPPFDLNLLLDIEGTVDLLIDVGAL